MSQKGRLWIPQKGLCAFLVDISIVEFAPGRVLHQNDLLLYEAIWLV